MFVRNFTTPPLSHDDVTQAELLAKIESVEYYCDTVYGTGAAVPCALLVLAKLITTNSNLSKKYSTIAAESIGDYSYRLGSIGSSSSKTAFDIAKSWEEMAVEMLRKLAYDSYSNAVYHGIFITNQ